MARQEQLWLWHRHSMMHNIYLSSLLACALGVQCHLDMFRAFLATDIWWQLIGTSCNFGWFLAGTFAAQALPHDDDDGHVLERKSRIECTIILRINISSRQGWGKIICGYVQRTSGTRNITRRKGSKHNICKRGSVLLKWLPHSEVHNFGCGNNMIISYISYYDVCRSDRLWFFSYHYYYKVHMCT